MTKEVVLVTSFIAFIGMKIEEYMSVQTLTKDLIKIFIYATKIRNNGAHKRGSSTMFRTWLAGWV